MRDCVLVTRPQPGLGETMAAVAGLGLKPVAAPLLRIRPLVATLPPAEILAAIVVTSGQAIAGLDTDPAWRRLPLFAVGDASARRARQAGFADSRSASGDADALATLIRASLPAGAALLLATGCGEGVALAAALVDCGYRVHRREVYRADPERRLAPDAEVALLSDQVAACLFFSAATARTFGRIAAATWHPHLGAVRALAISAATGAVLTALPWLRIEIAARPDAASVLTLLRSQA